jgi:hypothetical protein
MSETAFFVQKHKNLFSWTKEQPLNFVNLISQKIPNKINLNDSYDKINDTILNYYNKSKEKPIEKEIENKNSFSKNKNIDMNKILKNTFEKPGKIINENDINNFSASARASFSAYSNGNKNRKYRNSMDFNKSNFTEFLSFKEKGSVLDSFNFNLNKSEKKNNSNNLNSDFLRLELMNINFYSKKDINNIKDNHNYRNKFCNIHRRTKSVLTDLDYL